MKILFFVPGFGRSGGLRVIGEYAKRMADRGHYVALVSNANDRPDWFDLGEARVLPADRAAVLAPWSVVFAVNDTTVKAALNMPAQQHVFFAQMWDVLFRGPGTYEYDEAERMYHVAAQEMRCLTISQWLVDRLEAAGAQDVLHVPNGVNREHFYQVETTGAPYILVEGDARNHAKDVNGIGWQVALEMRERYGIAIHGMAACYNANVKRMDRFVYCPNLQDYRQLYSGARFMIKASRYEGRSLAPLEAMVCGAPTVRALELGDDDLVDEDNCLRSGYDYVDLLANATRMMEDDALYQSIRNRVRMYAGVHLHWDPIIDQVMDWLQG